MSKFEPDHKLQQVAEAYSRDLVTFALKQFDLELDWSDESILAVEGIGAALHHDYRRVRPTDEQIEPYYRMLGSYIGEVYRRNHGADWGWSMRNGYRIPGMKRHPDTLFWPWARAHNRIVRGADDNLWQYYQHLLGFDAPDGPP
jgi:hypothetical protein